MAKRIALFILVAFALLSPALPASAQSQYMHNGSHMEITIADAGDYMDVRVTYYQPRDGMRAAGAREGSVLFMGHSTPDGSEVTGTAYIFKRGCAPAPYPVTGRFENETEKLLLFGAYPVFGNGCTINGYNEDGSNARLQFDEILNND